MEPIERIQPENRAKPFPLLTHQIEDLLRGADCRGQDLSQKFFAGEER